MTRILSSAHRVSVIARNTVREGTRQRVLVLIGALALALVFAARSLSDFNFGTSESKFVSDFAFGAMSFFGAALTIVASSQLFFSEIDQRTVLTLLAKPVGRAEFVVGKYVGVAVLTAAFCSTMTIALVVVLQWRALGVREVPIAVSSESGLSAAPIIAAGCAQWLKLLVLSAFTLLVASFGRSQLFATGIGFVVLVCGHLQFILQNTADRGGAALTRVAAFVVGHSVPDFQLFDLSSASVESGTRQWIQLGQLSIYSAMYVSAVGVLAVAAFRRREF